MSAVQRSLVPSCAPATEYVAIPDGSSSAAPVITPGPSDFNSNRIHRAGANVGTKESERELPANHSANPLTSYMAHLPHAAPKWSNVTRRPSSPLLSFCLVRKCGLSCKPVPLSFTREVENGNPIDRSFGRDFARWRRLGIPSLAQLALSQDDREADLSNCISCGSISCDF